MIREEKLRTERKSGKADRGLEESGGIIELSTMVLQTLTCLHVNLT